MSETEKLVDRLSELDEALKLIKDQQKKINDEIKNKEEELIQYCAQHGIDVETATDGKYNIKPLSGRRLKKN
tara:strand:- start:5276 stop:5491 length:216 start_codon:yes stop_codon:yes gene_type:complete